MWYNNKTESNNFLLNCSVLSKILTLKHSVYKNTYRRRVYSRQERYTRKQQMDTRLNSISYRYYYM